jgi:hypothetical protein
MIIKSLIISSILLIITGCSSETKTVTPVVHETTDMKELSRSAYNFCKANSLNTKFYFLIDLKRHSGHKRFYVWDFDKDTLTEKYMVSHGCGNYPWRCDFTKTEAVISNTENSHCSSTGKYLVEERGGSVFGIGVKYNLTGLDKTNNKARKRAIVLHSWEKVTDEEVYPEGTAEGWGCPAVSNNSMKQLDKLLKTTKENTLMWVIN